MAGYDAYGTLRGLAGRRFWFKKKTNALSYYFFGKGSNKVKLLLGAVA